MRIDETWDYKPLFQINDFIPTSGKRLNILSLSYFRYPAILHSHSLDSTAVS